MGFERGQNVCLRLRMGELTQECFNVRKWNCFWRVAEVMEIEGGFFASFFLLSFAWLSELDNFNGPRGLRGDSSS